MDSGAGTPIVLIPGLQGRWEWMRPAVAALSRRHRVITFSLCDERTSPFPCDPERAFENYISQVELALQRARVDRAVIAGVSYGGLIAAEFAARYPDRVSGLVLASALHSSWQPDANQQRFLKAPLLTVPMFLAGAAARVRAELGAALPAFGDRLRFTVVQGARVVLAPTSPLRMARRIAWAGTHRFADLRLVRSPALIVTGEAGLDRVVPVNITRRYLDDVAGAEHVVLERTGHNGLVTRPDAFAGVVERFMDGGRISA
ncbi:MAG: alpha/beta hydrolase [Vicinamibacterales bacterium]